MGNATHFFLGANSGLGFQNLFTGFCEQENFRDLLILKGGPGCGKSTMMRKIGRAMEERGETVEYLHCSGDPDSLDGVYIPRTAVAVVDGTSPHIIEPRYPAAVDRYINLGQFYNIEKAKQFRDEIIFRTGAYKTAYRDAYHVLRAARELEEQRASLLRQGMDWERLRQRADGIISREIRGRGSGQADQYRFLGSLTHKGAVWRFDSAETLCPRIYHLLDSGGFAAPMLQQIHAAARVKGYASVVCPDPEHTEQIHHLLIPEIGVAFLTIREEMEHSSEPYRRIHLDAMVSQEHRKRWKGKLKLMRKMVKTLRSEAVEYLSTAKNEHDQLEAIYRPYVDFDGLDALTAQEINRIMEY